MQSYSFHIPHQVFVVKGKLTAYRMPLSLNKRVHWQFRSKVAKAFRSDAYWSTKALNLKNLPCDRIKIDIENYTTHRMDRDNLYGAMKPIVDGIVDAGLVPDDSEDFVEETCRSIKVPHKADEKLLVTITICQ